MTMPRPRSWLPALALLAACGQDPAPPPLPLHPRAAEFRELVEALTAGTDRPVLRGAGHDLLFVPELRHVGAGPFHGEAAQRASRAEKPDRRDPLPAIIDFARQLAGRGIALVFVPVPAKVVVDPRTVPSLPDGFDPAAGRVDAAHVEFLAELRQNGVDALDLVPVFAAADGERRLYCRQDTHWTSHACALAARAIAAHVGDAPWRAELAHTAFRTERRQVAIDGDLRRMLGDEALPRETVELDVVLGPDGAPPAERRDSPVLLLGDSHCLVWHAGGDLHSQGAGLADHLALAFGIGIDVVGVRGSGATPSRIDLMRRGDDLVGKRLVVWCLSVREYTEGQGWSKVPVIR
jgi:alginate O-acetyltransferase complex protein AlgJ